MRKAVYEAARIICPMCDETKCVGRSQCKQISEYLKSKLVDFNQLKKASAMYTLESPVELGQKVYTIPRSAIREWTHVAEGLPTLHIEKYEEPDGSDMQVDVSDFQWVITASDHQTKARYETCPFFQGWVGEDDRTVRDVTHWMPMPPPPKGDC